MKELIDFIVLGIVIALIVSLALLLKDRYNKNYNEIVKKDVKSFSNKQIVIGICLMLPMGLWIVINLSTQNLILFEIIAGIMLISITAHILTKNKLALISGIIYPLFYYYWWNIFTFNAIAIFLALGAILMIQQYIKPKQMLIICFLLIIYDFIMVYITTDMVTAAHRIIETELPILVHIKCTSAKGIMLGIGDILFSGLLVLNVSKWKNYDFGVGLRFNFIFCALSISLLIIAIQITPTAVPATIPIMIAAGIAIGLFEMKAFHTKLQNLGSDDFKSP